MKIDWIRKLSSRKFWMCIIGFVTPIMTAFRVPTDTATQVTAIIMGTGCLIAYILSEGYVDANHTDENAEDNEND